MDFDEFSWKINEISWIFTISQGSLGNLGVYLIQPPKMCAGLVRTAPCGSAAGPGRMTSARGSLALGTGSCGTTAVAAKLGER